MKLTCQGEGRGFESRLALNEMIGKSWLFKVSWFVMCLCTLHKWYRFYTFPLKIDFP